MRKLSCFVSPAPLFSRRPAAITHRMRSQKPALPSVPPKRCTPRMLGPFFPDFSESKLMKSEIVREEMKNLERDYSQLAELGQRYQTFDREGKIIYVDSALDVLDRYAVFMTRLKLSEDFSTQMFINQYQLKLKQYGLTIDTLIENTRESLLMMKSQAKKI